MKFLRRLFAAPAILLTPPAMAQTAPAPAPAAPVAATPATTDADPALWVVKDKDTTIYLFGTVHLLKSGLSWFDEGVKKAFDSSDELVLEMVQPSPEAMQSLVMAKGFTTTGPTLTERLPEAEDRLDAELAALRFPDLAPRSLAALGIARALSALGVVAATLYLVASVLISGPVVPALVLLGLAALAGGGTLVAGRVAVDRTAVRQGEAVEDACRLVISRVVRAHVIAPVSRELGGYARFQRGLRAALA